MGGDDDMKEFTRDLLRVSRRAQICVGKVVKKYGISAAEEPFFMAVSFNDGSTQEKLTSIVGVDKAMTTRVISSLEKKGLVKRVQDNKDKRQNKIYKTEKMKSIENELAKDLINLNQIFAKDIDEEDINGFKKALDILEKNIAEFLDEE